MDKSKGKKIESDSNSSSDDEDSNHNAENGDTRNGVSSRLPNWLSVILCCFGGDRGDVRRETPQPQVPVESESESDDGGDNDDEPWPANRAEVHKIQPDDFAYVNKEQGGEEDEEEVPDDGRMHAWVGDSSYDAPAHGKGGTRKLIKKIIKKPPPPPPPPNSGR